jgi:hypothetical protein
LTSRGMPTFTSITVLGSENVGALQDIPRHARAHRETPQEKVRQSQSNEGVPAV